MQTMQRSWRRLAVIVAAVPIALVPTLQAAAAPVAISTGEPLEDKTVNIVGAVEAHGLSEETVARLERQAVLDELAAQIESSAKVDAADGSGLSGLVVIPERNELEAYWHGDVADTVEHHVEQAHHDGIT